MQSFPGARQEYELALSALQLSRASGTSHPLPSAEKQMAAPGGEGRGLGAGWRRREGSPPHREPGAVLGPCVRVASICHISERRASSSPRYSSALHPYFSHRRDSSLFILRFQWKSSLILSSPCLLSVTHRMAPPPPSCSEPHGLL